MYTIGIANAAIRTAIGIAPKMAATRAATRVIVNAVR